MNKVTTMMVMWLLMGGTASFAGVSADKAPDCVPLGVYLSWERTSACAKYSGIDRWDDVCRRLDLIKANHVDTLWVANMSETDLPRLIQECRKRGISLIPSMGAVEGKLKCRWKDGGKYYDSVVPRVVKQAGDSDTLIGWCLSDEPPVDALPQLEKLRQRFRETDPGRFSLIVTMWPQTPHVPAKTEFPVVCVDLYPFFGPNDPNGPHSDGASQNFFRTNARRMVESIGEKDIAPWIMGMCFTEIWGPRKYDDQWHLIGQPGSYLHWRCPSPTEMRWQVWETLRSGCKGIIIYTLAPEVPDPKTEKLPPPDVAWSNVLAKAATDLGPNALTNPDCTPTPQLKELGATYKLVAPHKALIRKWKAATLITAETTQLGRSQCFVDPTTGRYYAVVVNEDLHSEREIGIYFDAGTEKIVDIIHGRNIVLIDDPDQGGRRCTLTLRAGEGTIIGITKR